MIKALLSRKILRFYVVIVCFLAFLFPSKIMSELYSLPVDNYIYAGFLLIMLFYVIARGALNKYHFLFIFIVFLICFAQKQITPLHLLGLVVIDIIASNPQYYCSLFLKFKKIFLFSTIGIFIYSFIYQGFLGRYAFLGVGEVNISGLGIFLLGTILFIRNKYIGLSILLFGILTFSRNYLLALSIFLFLPSLLKIRYLNHSRIIRIFSFLNLGIISCVILIMLSFTFQELHDQGLIKAYSSNGVGRFTTFYEISNYHRFVVNTSTLAIYREYPSMLLTGIPIESFSIFNLEICRKLGIDFTNDRPHNFFFSYIQIYGLWSLPIFAYMNIILKKMINANNFHIFASIMIYGIFLGMGLSGYWFCIGIISLVLYSQGDRFISVTKK